MTIKTKGQKRKGRARVFAFIVFTLTTFAGYTYLERMLDESNEWIGSHGESIGTVIDSYSEIEEYRNRKGRRRTSENYYVDYEYSVDDEVYASTTDVSESVFSSLNEGDDIDIWYNTSDPYINLTKAEALDTQSGAYSLDSLIAVGQFTLPASLFIMFLLNVFYVRESGNELLEGFYTPSSWLDVDDNMLISLHGQNLFYFGFNSKYTAKVQKAYQEGIAPAEILKLANVEKPKHIPLAAVTRIKSVHDRDIITLVVDGKKHNIEFLNAGFKAHALDAIETQLPLSLVKSEKTQSRLLSAAPYIVALLAFAAVAVWLNFIVFHIIIGAVALVKIVPGLVRRTLSPVITTRFDFDEAAQSQVSTLQNIGAT